MSRNISTENQVQSTKSSAIFSFQFSIININFNDQCLMDKRLVNCG